MFPNFSFNLLILLSFFTPLKDLFLSDQSLSVANPEVFLLIDNYLHKDKPIRKDAFYKMKGLVVKKSKDYPELIIRGYKVTIVSKRSDIVHFENKGSMFNLDLIKLLTKISEPKEIYIEHIRAQGEGDCNNPILPNLKFEVK